MLGIIAHLEIKATTFLNFFKLFFEYGEVVQQDSNGRISNFFSKFPLKRGNEMIYVNVYYNKTHKKKSRRPTQKCKFSRFLSLGDVLSSTYRKNRNHLNLFVVIPHTSPIVRD